MQGRFFSQRFVYKGFFTILLILTLVLGAQNSVAQGNNIPLQGSQIMQLAQSGNISQAANVLSQQSNLPLGNAGQLLQSLQSGNKIDMGSASNLLDGIMSGQSGVNANNIGNITSMIQGLQNGQASPSAVTDILSQVTSGQMPAALGQALSTVQNLGNIQNIGDIGQALNNPMIKQQLANIFGQGNSTQAAQAVQAVSKIANTAMNPQALQQAITQAGTQAVAQALTQALQQSFPELAQALQQVLGGGGNVADAIQNALEAATGGGSGSSGGNTSPPPTGQGIPDTNPGQPQSGSGCGACACNDCAPAINRNHQRIRAHVTSEFEQHRNWIVTTYFLKYIAPAMMLMTEEFVNNMMQQVQIIGTFFDAKHQLETQRLFQIMTAQANKDYQPSEGLCEIGTNVRSLAASERKAYFGQMVFADRMMQRELSWGQNLAEENGISDRKSRLNLFINKFCDPQDNGDGLKNVCQGGGKNKKQINMDVDFTSAFENKLTLDVDFTKDSEGPATADEENIFALSTNLFANKILPGIPDSALKSDDITTNNVANYYMKVRSIAAKRSVAQNSFAAITALKAEGDDEVAPFLKAILKEAGVNPAEIEERLGEKPSYFAQMEVLTKDLYQNPSFYSNLYDKPVNIERKGAALQAIELMQDRDIYKSLLRSEAVLAVLLETLIQTEHDRVSKELRNVKLDNEAFSSGGGGGG